jgi:hypothetical protein
MLASSVPVTWRGQEGVVPPASSLTIMLASSLPVLILAMLASSVPVTWRGQERGKSPASVQPFR